MTAEILDEAAEDSETILVSWLTPLYAEGHVANDRKPGGPLPFVLITQLDITECPEESYADALVSVHVLVHKSAGQVALRDESDKVHRRILLLSRYLENVDLAGGRAASIESVSVFKGLGREDYGDEQILRKVGRYTLGLSYAKAQ